MPKEKKTLGIQKQRGQNWDSVDTDLLASLLMQHGQRGILNSSTNSATLLKKKAEWDVIAASFNASNVHVERDALQLEHRYKHIMRQLKVFQGWMRKNNAQTGGGFMTPKPIELKLEMTGPLLELLAIKAVAAGGFSSFDSDRLPQSNVVVANQSTKKHSTFISVADESMHEEYLIDENETNPSKITDLPTNAQTYEAAIIVSTRPTPETVNATVTDCAPKTPDTTIIRAAAPATRTVNSSKPFFPTQRQQRRRNPATAATNPVGDEQRAFFEMRRKFVEAEELRTIELHQLKLTLMRNMADERISIARLEHMKRIREIDCRIELRELLSKREMEFWNITNALARGETVPAQAATTNTTVKSNTITIDSCVGRVIGNQTASMHVDRSNTLIDKNGDTAAHISGIDDNSNNSYEQFSQDTTAHEFESDTLVSSDENIMSSPESRFDNNPEDDM